ncbi:MAG TPA: patatin-like phospholipase family protein [Casimicrobiaceae bacterium]|jgi:predicted acylesterase/phospholipase RssA
MNAFHRTRRSLACFAFSLTACAAIERPTATLESLTADGFAHDKAQRALFDSAIDRLAERAVARGDRTLDILMLSGGGQHGAYGIGFLRGWLSRTSDSMPRFDLVTGVSTGSLQAPYALIGTAEALATAGNLYREAATQFAPTPDYWFWLRRTGGVVDTTRFRAEIARTVDARMAERISNTVKEHRQLLIATTDFDLGVGRAWDLGAEMTRTPAALERVHDVILASCSIPGIFPPIILDGHVHADGGIIANALFPFNLGDFKRLGAKIRERGVTQPVRVRLWVIVNFWTHPRVVDIDPASRAQITQRSTVVMFASQQPQFLERLEMLARVVSSDVPSLAMEMRFTAIPPDLENDPAARKLFDEAWMQKLEGIGLSRAQSVTPWDNVVSPYLRPLAP